VLYLSAFICGQYLVLIFALGQEKQTYWPLMNTDQRR